MPPPGEARWVEVERERRVAGEDLWRNGHMERPCLRRASIVIWMRTRELQADGVRHNYRGFDDLSVSSNRKMVERGLGDLVEPSVSHMRLGKRQCRI